MANIYNEQGITQTPVAKIGGMSTASEVKQSAKYFEAIQDNFERKAKEHQALAEKLYENGSNIAITQGLNELSRNPKYATNPQAFAAEADKMAEKIYAQIDDPNMKLEVATNYELKKNPYINRAYDNMYRMQDQQKENQAVINLQGNMDAMNLSLRNIMSGTMGKDDLRVLSESKKEFDSILEEKNSQGFDMFTAKEKLALKKQYEKNLLDGIKEGFDNLPTDIREQIAKGVDDDITTLRKVKYNGQEYSLGARAVLPESMIDDIKKYIKSGAAKDRQQKITEFKMMQAEAEINFIKEKSKTAYDALLELQPHLSEKKKADYKALLESQPNYQAETIYENYDEAKDAMLAISNMPQTTDVQRAKILDEYAQAIINLNKSNQAKKLTVEDVNELSEGIYRSFNDKVFQEQVHKVFGKPGIFLRGFHAVFTPPTQPSLWSKIDELGLQATRGALQMLLNNDPEGAQEFYREMQKKAIRLRYFWLPLDNMKEGDRFELSGKTYVFKGYGLNDVFVEADSK